MTFTLTLTPKSPLFSPGNLKVFFSSELRKLCGIWISYKVVKDFMGGSLAFSSQGDLFRNERLPGPKLIGEVNYFVGVFGGRAESFIGQIERIEKETGD